MPASRLHLATRTPWATAARPAGLTRRHLIALGAGLTLATAALVLWPHSTPPTVPMEPLLASPVTGAARDWTLDFLRQTDTLHRLGRDGRIWVPQDQAATLRRQALALGLALPPAGTEPPRRSPAGRAAARPQWGELKPE